MTKKHGDERVFNDNAPKRKIIFLWLALFVISGVLFLLGILLGYMINSCPPETILFSANDANRIEYLCYSIISVGIAGGLWFNGFPLTIRSECIHEEKD